MKFLLPLGLALLLVACIDASHPLKGSHHRHLARHGHHEVRSLGFCDVDCSSLGVTAGNWIVSLADLGLKIVYVEASAALAIISFKLNLAVVLINGVLGVFDLSLGVGLLVNAANAAAKFVTGLTASTSLFLGATADFIKGVTGLAAVLVSNKASLVVSLVGSVFNISVSILAMLSSGATIVSGILATKAGIAANLLANFTIFIKNLVKYFISGSYDLSLGVFNLLGGIIDAKYAILINALAMIAQLFVGSAKISAQVVFTLVYNLLYFVDSIINGTIRAVRLVNLAWEFYTTGGNLLFSVTLDGVIIVGGAIAGTLSNFASLGLGVAFGGYLSIQGSAGLAVAASG